jgi:hypothetical protein
MKRLGWGKGGTHSETGGKEERVAADTENLTHRRPGTEGVQE